MIFQLGWQLDRIDPILIRMMLRRSICTSAHSSNLRARIGGQFGDTEISHFQETVIGTEQKIVWFEVSMNDAPAMCKREGLTRLLKKEEGLTQAQSVTNSGAAKLEQISTGHVLEHEKVERYVKKTAAVPCPSLRITCGWRTASRQIASF